jgi:hypothetical protein
VKAGSSLSKTIKIPILGENKLEFPTGLPGLGMY